MRHFALCLAAALYLMGGSASVHASNKSSGGDGPAYTYFKPIMVPSNYAADPNRSGPDQKLELIVLSNKIPKPDSLCRRFPIYTDAILRAFHRAPIVLNPRNQIASDERLIDRTTALLREVFGQEIIMEVRVRKDFRSALPENSFQCRR